jgi:transposase
MVDAATWAKRVSEWKASGLSSEAFCEGKDFTAGGLRYMAHRLARARSRPSPKSQPTVRLARVVRLRRGDVAGSGVHADRASSPALVVEIGSARVTVPSGAERATVATVLELLAGVAR